MNNIDPMLIDSNSLIQAKAAIEKQAIEVFMLEYDSIKEQAGQIYRMWQEDRILKPDLEKVAETIAIYAVVSALEKRGAGQLYAEVNKFRTKIKADGYYGNQLLEVLEPKPHWLNFSSRELWRIVVEESKLLQICLGFYAQELSPSLPTG